MSVKIITASFIGIQGVIVSVEVDITRGLPAFNIVGLPDASIKESKERVRSAIMNSGFDFPVARITVSLAPANIKKEGSLFDLPIAIGILLITNQIRKFDANKYLFMGELSLSGELKETYGTLPIVLEGIKNNIKNFIMPLNNAEECAVVKNSNIYAFSNLKDVAKFLVKPDKFPYKLKKQVKYRKMDMLDYSDVYGQESSKRAIEVAAAGGHNLALIGPPGCGKSMMAKRIISILPKMSYDEALEVTKIYSVSGKIGEKKGIMYDRPFRSPHHTSTLVSIIGGGVNLLPGEVSLAHNGVLFLDEMLEFKRSILEVLRQPLEDKCIKISRANGSVTYPANFMLVAALNPCPCGYFNSNVRACTCSEFERRRYLGKFSGPLLDRFDIFSYVNYVKPNDFDENVKREPSKCIRRRVVSARKIQRERYKHEKIYTNSQMNEEQIKKYCKLDKDSKMLLNAIYEKYHLSLRVYNKLLKLSRTIADLRGGNGISETDMIEALQYRKYINNEFI